MRTVAIINQKGGCGKTTTAINLAGSLARRGISTLLVDLDPQGHCAAGLGIPEDRIDMHIGQAMLMADDRRLDESRLLWRAAGNLDLAPSSMRLAGLEAARGGLADREDRDQRLAATLERFGDRYDWVIIDCPPSIGLLTYNALRAATEVVIPVETSFFAMKGAQRQVRTIRSLARRLGGQTPYRLLATMHDPDSALAADLLKELEQLFPEHLIPHVIRLDPKLREAATFGQPAVEYAPHSPGARDYTDVASHLIQTHAGKKRGRPAEAPARASESPGAARTEHSTDAEAREPAQQPGATDAPAPPPSALIETTSRAADLASRVRRLIEKSEELEVNRAKVNGAAAARDHRAAPNIRERLARLYGARETSRGVLFVHPAPPNAKVAIAGDFNDWSPERTPMRYNSKTGAFEAIVDISPGRCEYRLVVNGEWMPDPNNGIRTENPFGGANSVIVVTRNREAAGATEGAD